MKTFVFQGDSITDAGRNRDNNDYRGNGYPTFVAGVVGIRKSQALAAHMATLEQKAA